MSGAARRWGGLLTCGVVLTLPLTMAAPAGASSSGRNGGFAFQAEFSYKGMDADAVATTGPRARALFQVLDYGPAEQSYQSHPDWSPDGHWLAWGSNKRASRLMIARADGSHRRTVFANTHTLWITRRGRPQGAASPSRTTATSTRFTAMEHTGGASSTSRAHTPSSLASTGPPAANSLCPPRWACCSRFDQMAPIDTASALSGPSQIGLLTADVWPTSTRASTSPS